MKRWMIVHPCQGVSNNAIFQQVFSELSSRCPSSGVEESTLRWENRPSGFTWAGEKNEGSWPQTTTIDSPPLVLGGFPASFTPRRFHGRKKNLPNKWPVAGDCRNNDEIGEDENGGIHFFVDCRWRILQAEYETIWSETEDWKALW